MVLLVRHPRSRRAERSYAIGIVLGEFLGLEFETVVEDRSDVELSISGATGTLTLADDLLASPDDQWLRAASLPSEPAHARVPSDLTDANPRLERSLPVLYPRQFAGELIERAPAETRLRLDVFGSVFFMLTRYEEIARSDRDDKDRFTAVSSAAMAGGWLERPLVNEYVELLWEVLIRRWPNLQRRERRYRLFISHDVDAVSVAELTAFELARSLGADLGRRVEPLLALRRATAYALERLTRAPVAFDPYQTATFLMDVSEGVGVRSVFNFVANGAHRELDPRYDISHRGPRAMIRAILQREHEIGFHASFLTYMDSARTAEEFERLRRICDEEGSTQSTWGGRQHYLRWKNPTTWRNWDKCGLSYDSTLGFADHVGFRAGTCWEYPVFDVLERRQLALRERPLVAMESTLLSYMRLPLGAAVDRMERLAAVCKRYHGDFTLLWHGHMLAGHELRAAYADLVRAAAAC